MNIYDEAIKEVKDIMQEALWDRSPIDSISIKALERAKKVEELLGLYKKECKMIQRYINGSYQPMGEHLDNIKQIKLKEKELEELK